MSIHSMIQRAIGSATGYGRNVRAVCPVCRMKGHSTKKKNLNYDRQTNVWFCYRCHVHGVLYGQVSRQSYTPQDTGDEVSFGPPDHWAELYAVSSIACQKAKEYAVNKRKLNPIHIAQARLGTVITRSPPEKGEQDWRNRLIVPVLSVSNEWLGYVGRDITGKSDLPYMYVRGMLRGKLLYNQRALYEPSQTPVYIVEGTLDAVYLWPNAVALLGMWTDEQIDLLIETERPMVVLLDGDAWKKGEALADILKMYGKQATSVRLGPRLDPDDYTRDQIEQMVKW